jgi:hypothetical protein
MKPEIPQNTFFDIEELIQDVKQEILSEVVFQFVVALQRQGYTQIEFLEAVADFINRSCGYEAMRVMEEVIEKCKK